MMESIEQDEVKATVELVGDDGVAEETEHEEQVKETATASDYQLGKENDNNVEEETTIMQQQQLSIMDHWTLGPSSKITYRGSRLHVYDTPFDQFIIEEEEQNRDNDYRGYEKQQQYQHRMITAKRSSSTNFGLILLRTTYTIAALLMLGFLGVFSLLIFLFLLLNLPVESGSTNSAKVKVGELIGTVLALPILLYGMSSAMALGTTFVVDIWKGGPLYRQIMFNCSISVYEWIAFITLLAIPLMSMSITLLLQYEDFWDWTARIWMGCIFASFIVFAIAVLICEWYTYIQLVRTLLLNSGINMSTLSWYQYIQMLFLIAQSHRYSGRRKDQYLLTNVGNNDNDNNNTNISYVPAFDQFHHDHQEPVNTSLSIYSYITTKVPWLYELVDDTPIYPSDHTLPYFLSKHSFSLEKLYCGKTNVVVTASGPDSLSPEQAYSALCCTIVGSIITFMLLLGILVWMKQGTVVIVVLLLLVAFFVILPMAKNSWRVYQLLKNNNIQQNKDETTDSGRKIESIIQVWDEVCISRPKPWLCYTIGFIEVFIFFLWPLINIFITNTISLALIFMAVALLTWIRVYLDPSAILANVQPASDHNSGLLQRDESLALLSTRFHNKQQQKQNNKDNTGAAAAAERTIKTNHFYSTGQLWSCMRDGAMIMSERSKMNIGDDDETPYRKTNKGINLVDTKESDNLEDHNSGCNKDNNDENEISRRMVSLQSKSRMAQIDSQITRSRAVVRWIMVYTFLAIVLFAAFLTAEDSSFEANSSNRPEIRLQSTFYYPTRPGLAYQNCELTKDFTFPDSNVTSISLVDFAFLGAIAYEEPKVTKQLLDKWFGPGKVQDESDLVSRFRNDLRDSYEPQVLPVSFKLFSFIDTGMAVVSVRGSETMADWLVNMQLWLSSGLAQLVKHIVPYGWLWDPVMDDLISVVNLVESEDLKKVSYYRTVSAFIRALQNNYNGTNYNDLRLTGVSLGGGIAMISGAQTNVSTVAISGPNSILARRTFDPPLSLSALDNVVFNVIPVRDPIAAIGGRPRLHQAIDCRASSSNVVGCHSMWRSVCELMFQCGTKGRPALCSCVETFGYPEPLMLENELNENSNTTFAELCGFEQEE